MITPEKNDDNLNFYRFVVEWIIFGSILGLIAIPIWKYVDIYEETLLLYSISSILGFFAAMTN